MSTRELALSFLPAGGLSFCAPVNSASPGLVTGEKRTTATGQWSSTLTERHKSYSHPLPPEMQVPDRAPTISKCIVVHSFSAGKPRILAAANKSAHLSLNTMGSVLKLRAHGTSPRAVNLKWP